MEKTVKEVVSEIKNNLKERASHPFWSSYTIFFILLNWRAIFATIFLPSDDVSFVGKNKLDYVSEQLLDFGIDNIWLSFILKFIIPIVLVYVHYYFFKPIFVDTINKKVNKVELKRIEITKEKEKLLDDNISKWKEEFRELFKSGDFIPIFNRVVDIVYSNRGYYTSDKSNGMPTHYIPPNEVAFLESNGLISREEDMERLFFTEKGLFFVREIKNQEYS